MATKPTTMGRLIIDFRFDIKEETIDKAQKILPIQKNGLQSYGGNLGNPNMEIYTVFTTIHQPPESKMIVISLFDLETPPNIRAVWPIVRIESGNVEVTTNIITPNKELFKLIWCFDAQLFSDIIKKTLEMSEKKIKLPKKKLIFAAINQIATGNIAPFT